MIPGILFACTSAAQIATADNTLDLSRLNNPVMVRDYHLRDPSVLKVDNGYKIFYTRFAGTWGRAENWSIGYSFTRDFVTYEDEKEISPKGFASPGGVIYWHGRYIMPIQSYPGVRNRLAYLESQDLSTWPEQPVYFLEEGRNLKWNHAQRMIDGEFVLDGKTLHCFFVGHGTQVNSDGTLYSGNMFGHAVTTDPELQNWRILTLDKPLFPLTERSPDGMENLTIFRTSQNSDWTMIFSEGMIGQHLAIAASPNLTDWTVHGVLEVENADWLGAYHGAPFVWRDDDRWLMLLMGTSPRPVFGMLYSTDGKHWHMVPTPDARASSLHRGRNKTTPSSQVAVNPKSRKQM